MIRKLFDQVAGAISATQTRDDVAAREDAIRMATAVLMVDVARADYVFEESEFDSVLALIESHFNVAPEAALELLNDANEQVDGLTSLHDFTQLLHQNLDEAEKSRIIALLWRIAYADGRLDKYEDSLVNKISDLLHVSRGRVMRLKHDAELSAG